MTFVIIEKPEDSGPFRQEFPAFQLEVVVYRLVLFTKLACINAVPAACDKGHMWEVIAAYRLKEPEVGHIGCSNAYALDTVKIDDSTDAFLAHSSELHGDLLENRHVLLMFGIIGKSRCIDDGESLPFVLRLVLFADLGGCEDGNAVSDTGRYRQVRVSRQAVVTLTLAGSIVATNLYIRLARCRLDEGRLSRSVKADEQNYHMRPI